MHPIIDVRCRLTTPEAGEYFRDRLKRRGRFDQIESAAALQAIAEILARLRRGQAAADVNDRMHGVLLVYR